MSDEVIKVLLVEDDEDDYLITSDLLSRVDGSNYGLDWVKGFQEAIDAVGSNDYGSLLIDYRLGEKTGLDLVSLLRADGVDIPIIMMTGQGDLNVDRAAEDAGADDYLVKGELNKDVLDRAIRYAMRHKQDKDLLVHQATHDALTGLPNRTWIET